MKKYLLLALSLIMLFSGCGIQMVSQNDSLGNDSNENAATAQQFPTQIESPQKYRIKECSDFVDGFASVIYENTLNSEETVFAIINTQGKCVLSNLNGFKDDNGNVFTPAYNKEDYKITGSDAKPVYSDGRIFIPTRDNNNNLVFCLIDSTGKVIYNINVTERYKTSSGYSIKFLGNSCWKITNGPYYDRLQLFICGKNGGKYDFGDGSGMKCAELVDGYVLTSTYKSDFYTDEDTYEIYSYDGKKTSTSFSQDELEKVFKTDVKDFGSHVMMWETVPEGSSTNHWYFYNFEKDKKWVLSPNEKEYTMDLISNEYNENGEIIISASNYDDKKLYAYAYDNEGNRKTLGLLNDFKGYIFCNYDTRAVNGSSGALTYDDDKMEYGYFDFAKGKFTPLTKSYKGKEANTLVAYNASLMAIKMEGSDGNNYSALIDMECNEVIAPEQNVESHSVGPWLYYDGHLYDENKKDVFKEWNIKDTSESKIIGYGDGLFNCTDNYLNEESKKLLLSNEVDSSFISM